MKTVLTLRESWTKYKTQVMHSESPEIIEEARRAFYVGAMTLYNIAVNDKEHLMGEIVALDFKEFYEEMSKDE